MCDNNRIEYRSCQFLESFSLVFQGRVDTGAKCVSMCCLPYIDIPGIALCGTPEESLKNFLSCRSDIIAESKRLGSETEGDKRKFTSRCAKCPSFTLKQWDECPLIGFISFSMYPAPCQAKCIYCLVKKDEKTILGKTLPSESYEKVFDIVGLALKNNMIAKDAIWQVSSGEIAIHPYRDRIFDLIKNQTAVFLTNCFIYNERIAANLAANPYSSILFSIDSGTSETWRKVKGVDNFDSVQGNLLKYAANSAVPGQIALKYILMPGINDGLEDYYSIIEIVGNLNSKGLRIACDHRTIDADEKQREPLIKAAGRLMAMLQRNGLGIAMDESYPPEEIKQIVHYALQLVKQGRV